MILDSSAIVAVVLREPGFGELVRKVAKAETVAVPESASGAPRKRLEIRALISNV